MRTKSYTLTSIVTHASYYHTSNFLPQGTLLGLLTSYVYYHNKKRKAEINSVVRDPLFQLLKAGGNLAELTVLGDGCRDC
jgi:hypothetical protein